MYEHATPRPLPRPPAPRQHCPGRPERGCGRPPPKEATASNRALYPDNAEPRPPAPDPTALHHGDAAAATDDALDLGEQRDAAGVHAHGDLRAHRLAVVLLDEQLDAVPAGVGGQHGGQTGHVPLGEP